MATAAAQLQIGQRASRNHAKRSRPLITSLRSVERWDWIERKCHIGDLAEAAQIDMNDW